MYKKIENEEPLLFYIMLALFAIDFFLQGMTIFFVLAVVALAIKRNIVIDRGSLVLFAFTITFTVFYALTPYFDLSEVKTALCILLAFILGENIQNNSDDKIMRIMVFVALFMAAHALLNLCYNFSQFGSSALSISRSYDIWTQDISGSTGQASKFTPFIALFFYLFYYSKKVIVKVGMVLILVASIVYDLELGGRTAFILIICSLGLGVVLGLIKEKEFRKGIRLVAVIVVVLIVAYLAYNADAFGIKTAFEQSYFNHRFYSTSGQSITEDSRMSRKIIYIQHLLDYPFGGKHLSVDMGIGHAHELWLDIFDMAGLIPYIMILIYSFFSIKRAFRYFRCPDVKSPLAVAYLSFVIIMNLQFFVEPILEGSPKLIVYYCLIDGMVYQYLKNINNISYENNALEDNNGY